MLKMSVQTPARWFAHSLSTQLCILSGPAAVCGNILSRILLTSAVDKHGTCSSRGGMLFLTGISFRESKPAVSTSGREIPLLQMGGVVI